MEDFVDMLSGTAHDRLSSAIQGRGAFRRFKDAVVKMGIDQEWYNFQADAYKSKAIRWCEDNGIDYDLDETSKKNVIFEGTTKLPIDQGEDC